MLEQMSAIIRIEDYKLETLLRCPKKFARMQSGSSAKRVPDMNWRQMTHFAACHSINDLFMLPGFARTEEAVVLTVEKRWTNRHYKFHSMEHYLQTKQMVICNLTAFIVNEKRASAPILTFEQQTTYVEQLDMELSILCHFVSADEQGSPSNFAIQKFVVDEDDEAIELLNHMISVFCESAFGKLPACIEVLSVLSGRRHRFEPSEATLKRSLDYMYLAKSLLTQVDVFHENRLQLLH